jgi:hypothetical protein
MSTWIKVARFHLTDRHSYLVMPWLVLGLNFVILLMFAASGNGKTQLVSGNVGVIYLVFFALGLLTITRELPFALALGVSRRSYYAGTALLAVSLAAAYALGLAVLQVIERVTGGWGSGLHFFRAAYILAGPWYLTWLTSFVLLALMFSYGMWNGLVFRRWKLGGLLTFCALQAAVGLTFVIPVAHANAWPAVGRFFITLGAAGLTGLLAVLAMLMLAGGYATIRRVTV